MNANYWFLLGCLLELGMLLLALLLALAFQLPLAAMIQWNLAAVALGLAATLPLLLMLAWVIRSRWGPLARIRHFLEAILAQAFGGWSWLQIGMVALLAGVAEELLFRGVLQTLLASWLGPVAALLLASLLFGLCHSVTRAYVVLVTVVGVYFGGLWLWTGNLLVPMVAHGVYDLVALGYCLKWRGTRGRAPGGMG
jgi:uncharacterized protein